MVLEDTGAKTSCVHLQLEWLVSGNIAASLHGKIIKYFKCLKYFQS